MIKFIKKTKKTILSTIALLVLTIVFPISANASKLDSSVTANNNSDDIVIYLNNEQELQNFEQELAEQNALAQQQWQKAQKRADNILSILDKTQTSSLLSLNSRMSTFASTYSLYYDRSYQIDFKKRTFLGTDYFTGYLRLIGNTARRTSGSPYFTSVNSISFKSENTKNNVEDFTYQKAMLDGSRTCAVNGSCDILVYITSNNSHRYGLTFYKEFYASQNY